MAEFESPTYVLDLSHSLNRAHIEGAEPNTPLKVLVVPESDLSAKPIAATGLLSADSTSFSVEVVTPAGTQSHTWTWAFLKKALAARRDS